MTRSAFELHREAHKVARHMVLQELLDRLAAAATASGVQTAGEIAGA
jgi:hypothetical protein